MKQIRSLLLLGLFVVTTLAPNLASAFAEQPAAFILFDNTGYVTPKIHKMLREPVRWAYHFPDFALIDTDVPKKVAAENIFTNNGSTIDQSMLRKMAEDIPAEAVVLVMVHRMDQHLVQGFFWRGDHDTYVRTILDADIYVYRKTGDKFSKKRVRTNDIKELGNASVPEDDLKWAISKQVNLMENRPIIE